MPRRPGLHQPTRQPHIHARRIPRTADPAWRGSSGKDLALRFSLASGYYATSVIRELLTALEPTPAWQLESASA